MNIQDYEWGIDYENIPGQKEAQIPPRLFLSKLLANRWNKQNFPKGVVKHIKIKEVK